MGRTMRLGSGPTPEPGFGFGVSGLDRALGPLIRGENVLWGLDRDMVSDVRDRIGAAASPSRHYDARTLDRLREDVAAESGLTAIVDLTDVGDEFAGTSWAARMRECACAVFASASVCHWLVPRAGVDAASWNWPAQCVLSVDEREVTVCRADGRTAGHLRVPLDSDAPAGSRRSALGAANLGRGLRVARIERGWSQAELGRRVGVSASAISQMERGRLGLSLETVIEVSEQLGVTIDDLLRGDTAGWFIAVSRPGIASEFASARGGSGQDSVAREAMHTQILGGGGTLTPPVGPSGRITILVGSGQICVERAPQRTLVRAGDIVDITRAVGVSVSNLGSHDAVLFWF